MSSFPYRLVFITVSLLANFTFSVDQSKNVLCKEKFSKRNVLSKQVKSKQHQVFVFGHIHPDTDAITSALVYADFLRRKKINAKAYRLGNINNETSFVLKKAGMKAPDLLPDHLAEGTAVALVDHNESQQSMENLKSMRVTHVIDHHKLGDLATSAPVYLRFEPVGSTATILTKLYRENKLRINKQMALLLVSAILSDTLHFRSSTTTEDDRLMVSYLSPIAKLVDVAAYANEMFAAKSDLTNYSMQQILLLDYKRFVFEDQRWGIGVAETFYPNNILERKDELLIAMADEKKTSQLTGILFSIIDIAKVKNVIIILDELEGTVVRKVFNVDVIDGAADLGSRISRKKDIIPLLELYFKPNSHVQGETTFAMKTTISFRPK